MPLQTCLMIDGKARAYSSEAPVHSGRLWSYPQTLDQSGEACRGQATLRKLRPYKV
jgi:hypothetical protein